MTGIVIDPQASGWRDDGSESGIQRIQVASGDLVAVPFRQNNCSIQSAGTPTAVLNASNLTNFDGTATGLFCNIPAAAGLGGGLRIAFWVNGPKLAIRYSEVSGFALPLMAVNVDGVSYDVPRSQSRDAITGTVFTNSPAEIQLSMIAESLGNGPHFVEIFLQQDTTTARRVYLHGFMADASSGYARPAQGVKCGPGQITVTTSYGNILSGNSALAAVRKLFFYNPTAGAIVVSVRSASTAANPFWVKSVAIGDTAELDFGGLAYDIATIQVIGSANGVICSLIGAQ